MKRVLTLLALGLGLLLVTACHFDINLTVEATAELTNSNGIPVRLGPATYEGFHHNILSDSELEHIFTDLTRGMDMNFQTAVLNLSVYDSFSREYLRDESYGVVYNSFTRHFDFADLNVIY